MKKKLTEIAEIPDLELQAVEVCDHRVSRMLEDWSLLRYFNVFFLIIDVNQLNFNVNFLT